MTDVKNALIEAYRKLGIPTDQLPYTEQFDSFWSEVQMQSGKPISRHNLWLETCRLRKAGKLPRVTR